jgi:hypothetical protein
MYTYQNSNVPNLDVAVLIWRKGKRAARDLFLNDIRVGGRSWKWPFLGSIKPFSLTVQYFRLG